MFSATRFHSVAVPCVAFSLYETIHLAEIEVLEDNSKLQNILDEFLMPTIKRDTLSLAGFGKTTKSKTL